MTAWLTSLPVDFQSAVSTACGSTHPHVKLSSIVARLDLEDVEGAGVARGGLHLEDVCRHTAPRRQVHVSVQNSEGFVPAGRVLSRTQALTAERGETHGGLELWAGSWAVAARTQHGEALTCH